MFDILKFLSHSHVIYKKQFLLSSLSHILSQNLGPDKVVTAVYINQWYSPPSFNFNCSNLNPSFGCCTGPPIFKEVVRIVGLLYIMLACELNKLDNAKKADPKAQALKAAKVVKSGGQLFKKKVKKIRTSVTFHRPKTLKKERNPKYPRISAPPRNKLDHYQILKFPLTTESAMKKIEDNNTLVFVVDLRADKKKIKDAVKKMYDIQAKKVNTLIRPDGTKKAYVRLTPDYDALDVANKIVLCHNWMMLSQHSKEVLAIPCWVTLTHIQVSTVLGNLVETLTCLGHNILRTKTIHGIFSLMNTSHSHVSAVFGNLLATVTCLGHDIPGTKTIHGIFSLMNTSHSQVSAVFGNLLATVTCLGHDIPGTKTIHGIFSLMNTSHSQVSAVFGNLLETVTCLGHDIPGVSAIFGKLVETVTCLGHNIPGVMAVVQPVCDTAVTKPGVIVKPIWFLQSGMVDTVHGCTDSELWGWWRRTSLVTILTSECVAVPTANTDNFKAVSVLESSRVTGPGYGLQHIHVQAAGA
ncbi:hypothetical protein VNO78_14768 [Psophocarpus tetragonolobus]|uniref:Large ribosomal subunit protein uL23 N-terminal domain-containing protein n=1 Tax=Psophocarpus tetragonolobus TaxID=3891 RepID=A0AAN9SDF4_PSOTE